MPYNLRKIRKASPSKDYAPHAPPQKRTKMDVPNVPAAKFEGEPLPKVKGTPIYSTPISIKWHFANRLDRSRLPKGTANQVPPPPPPSARVTVLYLRTCTPCPSLTQAAIIGYDPGDLSAGVTSVWIFGDHCVVMGGDRVGSHLAGDSTMQDTLDFHVSRLQHYTALDVIYILPEKNLGGHHKLVEEWYKDNAHVHVLGCCRTATSGFNTTRFSKMMAFMMLYGGLQFGAVRFAKPLWSCWSTEQVSPNPAFSFVG